MKSLFRLLCLSPLILIAGSCVYMATAKVPKEEYRGKLLSIQSMDQKNIGQDLQGWSYIKLDSKMLDMTHRYYYYPSAKPDAPVILFIHGLNLDGRNFLHFKGLASDYELIAYDLPESTPLYTGNWNDFLVILNDFVEQMGIKELNLCGVSFGANLAVQIAVNNPKAKVDKVILISSYLFGTTAKDRRFTRKSARIIGHLDDYKLYFITEFLIKRAKFPESDQEPPFTSLVRIKNMDWYRQVVNVTADYDMGPVAASLTRPVLMLQGTADETVDPEESYRSMTTQIPRVEFHYIEGGTHAMSYFKAELITRYIREFLAAK